MMRQPSRVAVAAAAISVAGLMIGLGGVAWRVCSWPADRIEANGVHVKRTVIWQPVREWLSFGQEVIGCGPEFSGRSKSYGPVALDEERTWKPRR